MARFTTVPGLFPPPRYSHAAVVEAGERLVLTAGAVPLDAHGALVGPDDLAAQTRQVLTNLAAQLEAAGSGLDQVIASTVYVVGSAREDLSAVWEEIRASDLSTGPHTSTIVGVTVLGYPGQLVEITATGVVRNDPVDPASRAAARPTEREAVSARHGQMADRGDFDAFTGSEAAHHPGAEPPAADHTSPGAMVG
ncbi:RidA family protein [Streptomyces sp. NPDC059788]|uniref:RidA family protein n=1 Tax=Streptomyces sp. NPDC059788 TaxID=3346948 RepID=UPI00365FC03E